MRALLGILLCVLLLQTQVFALSGGPDYSQGTDITNILGTYGGVLVEQCNCDGTSIGGSLAVYTVNIVRSGVSTGTVTIFNAGRIYPGTITGVGDNTTEDNTFKGIIEASFNFTLILGVDEDGNLITSLITAGTNGILETEITPVRNGAATNNLMTGTATLELSNGNVDDDGNLVIVKQTVYDVSGYRQALATN